MTIETLDRANKLRDDIAILKKHKEDIKGQTKNSGSEACLFFGIRNYKSGATILAEDLLPIKVSSFIGFYLTSLDEEINKYQTELNQL